MNEFYIYFYILYFTYEGLHCIQISLGLCNKQITKKLIQNYKMTIESKLRISVRN